MQLADEGLTSHLKRRCQCPLIPSGKPGTLATLESELQPDVAREIYLRTLMGPRRRYRAQIDDPSLPSDWLNVGSKLISLYCAKGPDEEALIIGLNRQKELDAERRAENLIWLRSKLGMICMVPD